MLKSGFYTRQELNELRGLSVDDFRKMGIGSSQLQGFAMSLIDKEGTHEIVSEVLKYLVNENKTGEIDFSDMDLRDSVLQGVFDQGEQSAY